MVETIKQCISIMKEEVTDPYCLHYIDALTESIDSGMIGLETQLSYILSNANNWQGETATEVKSFIRNWIKQKRATRNNRL